MDELQSVPVALALGRCGCQRSTMPSSNGVDPVTADHVGEFRRQVMANGRVVARADNHARHLFPVAIGPEEGEALLARVVDERAHRTLESGLGFGISTLFVCQGLLANGADGRHVAADPFQFESPPLHAMTYAGVGLQLLEEAGVRTLVEFYPEESQIVFPRLLAEGRESNLGWARQDGGREGVHEWAILRTGSRDVFLRPYTDFVGF
jgi:hypothetical protein